MEEYVWISKLVNHPVFTSRSHPVLNRLAEEYDVRVTFAGSDDTSVEPYVQAVYDAVERRVSGIMVIGWGDEEIVAAIDTAVAQGIPVVTVDSDVPNSKRLAHIGTDWYRMGGAMADELATRIGGRGQVLMIGMTALANMQAGFSGFRYRMKAYNNVEILGPEDDMDVGHDRSQAVVSDYLKRYPELAGVASFDGNGGPGAARAIEMAKKSESVKLVCVDADDVHISCLRNGTADSLFAQKREAFTNLAFQMLYSYNHGSVATGYRPGAINIPGNIDTGHVIVTRNNIDTYEAEFGHEDAFKRHDLSQRLALVSGVVENSAEIALAGDLEGCIIYANRAAINQLELDENRLHESSFGGVFKFTDEQEALATQCVSKGIPARFEASIGMDDGATFHYQVSLSPLKTDQLIQGMVLIASDISSLREARDSLHESENKFRNLFHNTHDAVFVHDLDGKILDANNKVLELFGYTREDILRLNIGDLHSPEELEDSRRAFEGIRRDGFVNFEIKFIKKNGDEFLAEVSSSLFTRRDIQVVQGIVRDITLRKKTEEALRESEERFRLLSEAAEEGIIIHDGGVIVDANDALARMFGYELSELIGMGAETLVTPESQKIMMENIAKGYEKAYELVGIRKDGSPINCHVVGRSFNYKGRKLRVAAVRDITDRKKADEALRESEERFRVAFRTSPDAISITRIKDGKYIDINDGFTTLTGYEREEVIGRTSVDIKIWNDLKDRAKLVDALQERGYLRDLKAKFRFKDGRIRTGLMSANIISLHGESYILSVSRDIEDAIKSEKALRESEERFRALFETAQDAIFLKDDQLRYVAVNPSMANLLNISPSQFVGRNHEELWGPEGAEYNRKMEHQVLKGEIIGEESRQTIKDEPRVFHIITVPMRDASGAITGLCGIARDITETKRLQEFAERAQRLEAAGRIAGQVAHDFNNLLGPLIAYPGLMRDELDPDHPAVEYLNDIEAAAEQMADINQQLLTLGRRGHYNMEPLNINGIIEQVVERMLPNPIGVTVKTDLTPDVLNIKGGSSQIYRVISNLIANSMDAMSGSGQLTIKTENYYVDSELGAYNRVPRGEYVKITIADTGCGILEDNLPGIFDPFFTTKTADRKKGSGLGLSIVHSVVNDHGGYIDVTSQPDRGTSFYLYFAITRESIKEVDSELVLGGNEKILVIDDDPVQNEVTSRLLQKLGYQVHTALSGELAVEHLKKHHEDILILDMVMSPGIDGAETYRRALEINREQKAIIVSGFAETDRVKQAISLGAGPFIRKPLTRKSLAAAVRKGLDHGARKSSES